MISMRLRRLYRRLSYLTGVLRCFRPGMQARIPLSCNASLEPVSIIAAVAKQPPDVWQAAQQSPRADVIAHLSGSDEQIERSPLAVADGVQLGVHAAFGAADQASTPPFLTAMLVAVRCAFRYVASIITVFSSPCSAARPAIIRAKIPFPLQRFQRL